MSEIKITYGSLENAILKDGQLVFGVASGNNSSIIADGFGTFAGGWANNGYVLAKGAGAHAEGQNTNALNIAAHAEGYNTTSNGQYSHAEGEGCYKQEQHCTGGTQMLDLHKENEDLKFSTSNRPSTYIYNYNTGVFLAQVQGYQEISDTDWHFTVQNAEQRTTLLNALIDGIIVYTTSTAPEDVIVPDRSKGAIGYASHAEGVGTNAKEKASHAGGIGTIANQEAMTAIGKYNVSTNTENTLFVVGDGIISNADEYRSDAFRVNSLGSETETNLVPSSVQAKVNGVSDVYIGCPIGTVVMWPGKDAPQGWYVCNGEEIWNQNTKPSSNMPPYASQTALYGDTYKNLYNALSDYTYWYYTCRISGNLRYWVNGKTWTDDRNNIGYSRTQLTESSISPTATYYDFKATQIRRLPDFRANFAIGYDSKNPYGTGLNHTDIGYYGGEASHKLTANESGLPAHKHTYQIPASLQDTTYTPEGTATRRTVDISNDTSEVSARSAQEAHNNIPPFLAINFIIKYK